MRPLLLARSSLLVLAAASAAFLPASSAHALVNAGAAAGAAHRTADAPDALKTGVGWQLHAELQPIPMFGIGPYFARYVLQPETQPSTGVSSPPTFDVLGARARFTLPIKKTDLKPYLYTGFGRTWVSYPAPTVATGTVGGATRATDVVTREGRFWEFPIGLGLAYHAAPIVDVFADFALRPGTSFKGSAFEDAPRTSEPKSGWTLMLGVALDL